MRIRELERRIMELEGRTPQTPVTSQAQRWSRVELEQLRVKHLCRWLEELGVDISPAVSRSEAKRRLWQEIDREHPPALAAIHGPQDLERWSLQEVLRWLEYFGGADEQVVDKTALVQMLLLRKDLTTPAFLGESAADEYLAQVRRHLSSMKKSVTATLEELLHEAKQYHEADGLHEWWPNGRMADAFQGVPSASRPGPGLSLRPGDAVDVNFHETNGWAWCIAESGGGEGWVPASKVFEVARVLKHPREENGKDGMLPVLPDEEVEVVFRHYTGWTLCKRHVGIQSRSDEDVGWVPDPCLSDHPRNASTKHYRLLGRALYRLAGDILEVEAGFSKLEGKGGLSPTAPLEVKLKTAYGQVLAISEEYHRIQVVLQAHANAAEQGPEADSWRSPPSMPALTLSASGGERLSQMLQQYRPPAPEQGSQPQHQDLQQLMRDLDAGSVEGLSSARASSADGSEVSTPSLSSKKVRAATEHPAAVPPVAQRPASQAHPVELAAPPPVHSPPSEPSQVESDAVALLQSVIRRFYAQAYAAVLQEQARQFQQRQTAAAVRMQALCRRWLARRSFCERLLTQRAQKAQIASALQIQAAWRGYQGRKQLKLTALAQRQATQEQQAAVRIQGLSRMRQARLQAQTMRQQHVSRQLRAVVTLQRWCRGHQVRKSTLPLLRKRRQATLRLQGAFRARRALIEAKSRRTQREERLAVESRAATTLQRCWRGRQCRRHVRQQLQSRHQAALRIQGLVRIQRARAEASALREHRRMQHTLAAISLQRWYRGHHCRRRVVPQLRVRRQATLRIQGLLRLRRARLQARDLRQRRTTQRACAAIVLQRWWRGHRCRKHTGHVLQARRQAALRIQGLLHVRRARLEARRLRERQMLRREHAAITLQQWCRGWQCRKRMTPQLQSRRRAALRIQGLVHVRRARLEAVALRLERATLRARAAISLQRRWRGCQARKRVRALQLKRHHAALRIQGLLYIRRARLEARALRKARWERQVQAALVLQRWCRGQQCRKRLRPQLLARRQASLRIQSLLLVRRARLEARSLRAERAAREARAATLLQSWCRGFQARRQVSPTLRSRRQAARRIQGLVRGRQARLLARSFREKHAVACIRAVARSATARWQLVSLRWLGAAVRLQACWRGVLGRRKAMRWRAEAVTGLLDALCQGEVPSEKGSPTSGGHSAAWLERVNAALNWKDQNEEEEECHQLVARRRAEASKLAQSVPGPGGEPQDLDAEQAAAAWAAAAALDRELVALSAAQGRAKLRRRAMLRTQLRRGCDTCDSATSRALVVDEGLLARLRVDDAIAEVASIANAAWNISAASRSRRQRWAPQPLDTLLAGVKAALGRVRAELARNPSIQAATKAAEDGEAEAFVREEVDAVRRAQQRAQGLKDSVIGSLTKERVAAREQAEACLKPALQAIERTATEVRALEEKCQAQVDGAENALRAEREAAHAQAVVLEELSLAAQIEKERLDAALANRKPRARVLQKILTNVKKVQQQMREQEVNGTINRASQGILAHSLRQLETRTSKALQGCRQSGHLVPIDKNETIKDDEDDFKPSLVVQKRQEGQAGEERRFKAALEAEVSRLRAEHGAKADLEVKVLGAKLRAEAEVFGVAASAAARRLAAWRGAAQHSRPWLGEVMPLAQASAVLASVATRVRDSCGPGCEQALVAALRVTAPRLENLWRAVAQAAPAESPREGVLGELQTQLEGVQRSMEELCAKYPDVDPGFAAFTEDVGAEEGAASEAATAVAGEAALPLAPAAGAASACAPEPSGTLPVQEEPTIESLPAARAPPAEEAPPAASASPDDAATLAAGASADSAAPSAADSPPAKAAPLGVSQSPGRAPVLPAEASPGRGAAQQAAAKSPAKAALPGAGAPAARAAVPGSSPARHPARASTFRRPQQSPARPPLLLASPKAPAVAPEQAAVPVASAAVEPPQHAAEARTSPRTVTTPKGRSKGRSQSEAHINMEEPPLEDRSQGSLCEEPAQKVATGIGQRRRRTVLAASPPAESTPPAGRSDKVGAALRPALDAGNTRTSSRNLGRSTGQAMMPTMQRWESEPMLRSSSSAAKPLGSQKLVTGMAQGSGLRAVQKARRNLAE